MKTTIDYIKAHKYSIKNNKQILSSKICGCFYCLKTFSPDLIKNWIDYNGEEQTALCPYCNIDSVIGSSNAPITKEFLRKMNGYWFESR